MSEAETLQGILRVRWAGLNDETYQQIGRFREELARENATQNLTKLISPTDFYEGHIEDVRALLDSGFLHGASLDLGSGCGVPGLLSAIVGSNQSWVLAESEGHKARFLSDCVKMLGLSDRVRVFSGRGELYLKQNKVTSVVCRAVGPLPRLFGWLQGCSTWNKLVLFKGPKWDEEWAEFSQGRQKSELVIGKKINYSVGAEQKKRVLVELERVPRGTIVR